MFCECFDVLTEVMEKAGLQSILLYVAMSVSRKYVVRWLAAGWR